MYIFFKHFFDVFFSVILLIVLFPFLILIIPIIYISMGSPVIFKQERIGLNNRVFTFYKFRTMSQETDSKGNLLPDNQRETLLGKYLRKFSIDELPQLINILKGEMSFIGPRPLLTEYKDKYSPFQLRRHLVKPGISGLAQVNGRNSINWEEKFKLDVEYVENYSLFLDLKIVFLTLSHIFFPRNINQSKNVTMPKFEGKNE